MDITLYLIPQPKSGTCYSHPDDYDPVLRSHCGLTEEAQPPASPPQEIMVQLSMDSPAAPPGPDSPR